MLTECSPDSFDFASLGSRKVTAAFDGSVITSNAGALLLRETDRGIGLSRQVSACFRDGREAGPRRARGRNALVAQRIHGIALGYEDLNDHDDLRHDPVLGLVSGKAAAHRRDCAVLAGKSTLNRLEHAPRSGDDRYRKLSVDEGAMKRLFVSLFLKSRATPQKRIILDLDATDDPISTAIRKAGSSTAITNAIAICRFTFSAAGSCFWRNSRPRTSTPRLARKEEIAWIVAQIRKSWPDVDIWLRADSGFCREELMAWCEASRRPLRLFRPCPQRKARSYNRRRTGRG